MQSLIPIEARLLSTLNRITSAQLESVMSAVDDGGIDAWRSLGFKTQREKAFRDFVVECWRRGEIASLDVLNWAKLRKGPKPTHSGSEMITKHKHGIRLIDGDFEPEYFVALKAKRMPVIGLAQVPPAEGLAWYKDYALALAGVADKELLDKAKSVVARGAELGLRPTDIKAELRQTFDSFSSARLNTLIRTESSLVYNTASLTRYTRDSSIVAYLYDVVVDDRTSEICLDYVDKIVPTGDLRDVPPLHYNCRTVIEPIFAGEDFTASDMEGVEPMAGFGNPFPSGTGVPGVNSSPLRNRGRR